MTLFAVVTFTREYDHVLATFYVILSLLGGAGTSICALAGKVDLISRSLVASTAYSRIGHPVRTHKKMI